MKDTKTLMSGAIVLLALALFANAVALLVRGEPTRVLPEAAADNNPRNIYTLSPADSYFITASERGDQIFLWKFKYHPREEENEIYFLKRAQAQ